jgi:plasmid stabilization system protein ParE
MPRGDKSNYTGKQERKGDHIAESYELRGMPAKEAERRAWATVNKESGGGKKSGSGRDQPESHASSQKGGRLGGTFDFLAGNDSRRVRRPLRLLPPHCAARNQRLV